MSRILVAEDERRIASFIEKGLRAAGFAVTLVADGSSAYDHAMSGRQDLLVLDVGLPLMDGFAVLRRLREAHNPIPVIILTARDSVGDTVAGLEGGADDYMAKPFRFDELLARIRLRLRSQVRAPLATVLRYGDLAGPAQPKGRGRLPHGGAFRPRARAGRDVPAKPGAGAVP